MHLSGPNRREFLSALVGVPALVRTQTRPARYVFTQYHNQTESSALHQRLVQMWSAIRTETDGRVDASVIPENNKIQGSDPAALAMLVAGEIQFFTLMGGILGNLVPAAEV